MVRSNQEGGSGGPFYRCLINQCGDQQELYEILNYGEAQTEPFRLGILNGPYTLVFTNGGPPPALDTSWVGSMGLVGYVAPAGRGSVTASTILNRDTGYAYTVGFSNATAQYWTQAAAANGAFNMSGMIPGTYTMRLYKGELAVHIGSVVVNAGGTTALGSITIASSPATGDPSSVVPLWRIGNWDGTPNEFLNADRVTTMHPSDVRLSPWNPGTYVVGASSPATGIPCYQWKDVNSSQAVQFNLTAAQLVASTIKVGITVAFEGARPKISVNAWSSGNPSPSSQPDTRTLTVGTYRGNNSTYTFAVPASALIAGTNTLWVFPISGSGASGFLSAGYSLDCIEMYQGAEQTAAVPSPPVPVTASGGNGQVTLNWNASPGATSYKVKRSITSGGPYTDIATGISATSYTDTGLRNGVAYYYVISATGTSGTGIDSTQAGGTPIGPELRTQLRFDESSGTTATDSTGNGWDGTLIDGPAWAAGRINNAVSLDGDNDHVTLPAGVLVGLGDFTISAWVKLNTVTNWSRVFDFGTGTSAYMFLTPKNSITNVVRFAISADGIPGEQTINGTAALPAGVWTHVAVSLSGAIGTLYVNGAAVGTNSAMNVAPFNLGNTTQNYLGKSQYVSDPQLNGMVDEFQIYGRPLSVAEIAALAAPPAAPTGLMATAGNAQVTLAWNTVAGATAYRIKRATATGGPYTEVGTAVTGSYLDTSVTNGTTYYYIVTAAKLVAESANSLQASSTPSSFAGWQQQWFNATQLADPLVSGPSADANRDGSKNILAYAFNISPWVSAASALPTSQISGGYLTISFIRRKAPTDLTYTVDVSSNLAAWNSGAAFTTQTSVVSIDAITERLTVRDNTPASGQKRYIRLRIGY